MRRPKAQADTPEAMMAHRCPVCWQACYCDGEDVWMDDPNLECLHDCDEDFDDDDEGKPCK